MKSEEYKGRIISFAKSMRFRTTYGYAGSNHVEAFVNGVGIARGDTKADALREAKKVIRG